MTGTWLGLAAAALSIGAWALWMRRIDPSDDYPLRSDPERAAIQPAFG